MSQRTPGSIPARPGGDCWAHPGRAAIPPGGACLLCQSLERLDSILALAPAQVVRCINELRGWAVQTMDPSDFRELVWALGEVVSAEH